MRSTGLWYTTGTIYPLTPEAQHALVLAAGTLCLSQHGPPPQIVACKKVEEERDRVAQWVTARLREGCQHREIGVFVRAEAQMDHARAAIKAIGVPALDLSNEVEVSEGRIALGTMHAAKGLEFRSVVVMACNVAALCSKRTKIVFYP